MSDKKRKGISLVRLIDMFPDDAAAERWFCKTRWPDGARCPHCYRRDIQEGTTHPTMPYRCRTCKRFFSVRIGTVMQDSRLGYQVWVIAIYLLVVGNKGVSSRRLHRDLDISQKAAWYLAHRIREGWNVDQRVFEGPTEVDETFIGGKEHNKHADKKLHQGPGIAGKMPVLGAKDRKNNQISTKVSDDTDSETLQNFVGVRARTGSKVYTDGNHAYIGMSFVEHHRVYHSRGQ